MGTVRQRPWFFVFSPVVNSSRPPARVWAKDPFVTRFDAFFTPRRVFMCKVQFKAYFAATFVVLLGTVGTFLRRANAQATSQPAALSGGSDAASSGTAGAGQANPF